MIEWVRENERERVEERERMDEKMLSQHSNRTATEQSQQQSKSDSTRATQHTARLYLIMVMTCGSLITFLRSSVRFRAVQKTVVEIVKRSGVKRWWWW